MSDKLKIMQTLIASAIDKPCAASQDRRTSFYRFDIIGLQSYFVETKGGEGALRAAADRLRESFCVDVSACCAMSGEPIIRNVAFVERSDLPAKASADGHFSLLN
jgi:hypothetical protein